jgi:hypothetical protein
MRPGWTFALGGRSGDHGGVNPPLASLLPIWVLALGHSGPSAPAETPDQEIARVLPTAARALRAGFDGKPAAELEAKLARTLGRLMLDDSEAALDSPSELHDLIVAAAAAARLEAEGALTPRTRLLALQAMYLLHVAGHAYEVRPEVRESVDSLRALEPSAPGPAGAEVGELVDSMRALRGYARRAFPRVLQGVLADPGKHHAVHHLRGLYLLREEQAEEAILALAMALAEEPRSRYAESLFLALLAADRRDEAQAVYDQVARDTPSAKGRLDRELLDHVDRRLTQAYEARRGTPLPLDEEVGQLSRYLRLGPRTAAEALAQRLYDQHGGEPRVRHAVARAWLETGRFGRAAELLMKARAAGQLDRKLLEAAIVLGAQSLLKDPTPGQEVPAAAGVLEADLAAYAAGADAAADRTVRAVRILLAVASLARGSPPAEGMADLERQIAQALDQHPDDLETLRLAAGAYLVTRGVRAAHELAMARAPKLRPELRNRAWLLVAELELGRAVRERNEKLAGAALARLEALHQQSNDGLIPIAEWRYAKLAARLARASMKGRRDPVEAIREPARRELEALPGQFFLDDDLGRLLEEASACAVAALDLGGGSEEARALPPLGRVRLLAGQAPLGWLASGLAALAVGDPAAAYGYLNAGLEEVDHPALGFAFHKWMTVAAQRAGDAPAKRRHLEALIDGWGRARVPAKVDAGVPMPVFVGGFRVEMRLSLTEPLSPILHLTPVTLLLPDFPHDRAQLVELLARLPRTPAGAP